MTDRQQMAPPAQWAAPNGTQPPGQPAAPPPYGQEYGQQYGAGYQQPYAGAQWQGQQAHTAQGAPAPAMPPIIEARTVVKTYDTGKVKVPALRGVTFAVQRGEMVAVMGPS